MAGDEDYSIGAELGRGAIGRVVIIEDAGGQRFAGKILHDSQKADSAALARFAGEAELASSLDHPNIARVHGLEEIAGESVLLMELVEGRSLREIIARDAPLDEARVIAFGLDLAAGLQAAHRAGLIHRDLKPDNVLVKAVDGIETAKIVDFGLARASSFVGVHDGAFAVVGTPDYMAPESIDPLAVDARSDLYALGCILFEMATAEPPFSGSTAFAVINAHREGTVDRSTLDALLSAPLADLIASLLAKSPADRPSSAAQVHAALSSIDGAETALAVIGATTLSSQGTCAACGAPALPEVGVCFGCGLRQVRLETGDHTVFVTGPGETTDKLDIRLRQVLVDWLAANPGLGIDPSRLEKRVPRLPFVLATKVSKVSGLALAESLDSLGFAVEVIKGGRLSLKAMRKKGVSLGGRFALIGVSSLAYGLHNILGPILVPMLGVGGLAAIGGGFAAATRPAAVQRAAEDALPAALAEPLDRVASVVGTIEHQRHRESLRGVVQRVLSVRETAGARADAELDQNLGELIDRALVAVCRMDAIDSGLAKGDLRNTTQGERKEMVERDALASRLLEITAFLDSMRARFVALASRDGETSALDDLRAQIAALEEIEAL